MCVHWQWNTLEWCQLIAPQASPVVHLVTPLECVSLTMNTQLPGAQLVDNTRVSFILNEDTTGCYRYKEAFHKRLYELIIQILWYFILLVQMMLGPDHSFLVVATCANSIKPKDFCSKSQLWASQSIVLFRAFVGCNAPTALYHPCAYHM